MVDKPAEFGSDKYVENMNETYDEALLECLDIIERGDFYGIVAENGLRFFGEKLGLTPESHLLDLCSGVGGPARFFAEKYGCKVTGVDISKFNHVTAQKRTEEAGLDQRVTFIHGNALEISLPEHGYTHVFGCEAWCYFPDKLELYQAAHRVLKPGGCIAFLESACAAPVRLHAEQLLGAVHYESIADYASMLRAAAFEAVECYDTTDLASKDIATAMYRLITKREQVIATSEEVYYALLEIWAEFLAYFAEGGLTHCGFIARRK